jgi:hypothetical protein
MIKGPDNETNTKVSEDGRVLYRLSESQKSIWYLEKAYPGTSLNVVAGPSALKTVLTRCFRKSDQFIHQKKRCDAPAPC